LARRTIRLRWRQDSVRGCDCLASAEFVRTVRAGHDFIIKEGWLGGELSTAWALQNLDPGRVKLHDMGVKRIDGHELHGIEYLSSDSADMTVKLYFDPETYRHVMTVYSVLHVPSGSRHGITNSAKQQELRFTIEERFIDFQTDKGLTLPRRYDLQYTEELQNGSTRVYDWDMIADKIIDTSVLISRISKPNKQSGLS
jgi:hypothetical protein